MARGRQEERGEGDSLLDELDEALQAADFEGALALADRGLERSPRDARLHQARAEALAGMERFDDAIESYRAALKAAPNDLEVLHGAIELLVLDLGEERESLEDALDLLERAGKLARKAGDPAPLREFLLLAAMALNKLGEPKRALALLDEALGLGDADAELRLERGISLFELCRFDEARRELERAISLDGRAAWAHHYLGLIAERRAEGGAARHFKQARRLAPEDFPPPTSLSPQAFDRTLEDALARLPERVREYLQNVTISVEELPREEDLVACDPPLSPAILGLFHGTPVTEERTDDPWSCFPSSIVLYQRNLERFARSRDELIEQIGITLIHEVGHFLGLSEEDLYARGLD